MTAEFPDAIVSYRDKENKSGVVYDAGKKTVGFAEDFTKLDEEVVAIETILGTNPEGAFATVKAWLTDLASSVIAHKTSHQNGGSDEISVLDLSGKLADAQTPLGHEASHTAGGSDELDGAKLEIEKAIAFFIDGGGSAITTGIKGAIRIPFKCEILSVSLLADQSGSIVIDIWKDTLANYPPTNADSITDSTPPTISTDTDSEDTTLTSWTKAIASGDVLMFNVDSVTDIEWASLIIKVKLVE